MKKAGLAMPRPAQAFANFFAPISVCRAALNARFDQELRLLRLLDLLFATWRRRQLQHIRVLAFAELRDQHQLAVGKFQRIVMHVGLVEVDLPEKSDPFLQLPFGKHAPAVLVFDIPLECDFRAGKEADGHVRLSRGGEAAGDGIAEPRGRELVSDACGPACNAMQAVVAHGGYSSASKDTPPCSRTTRMAVLGFTTSASGGDLMASSLAMRCCIAGITLASGGACFHTR